MADEEVEHADWFLALKDEIEKAMRHGFVYAEHQVHYSFDFQLVPTGLQVTSK
jgi:hypothetical protein